MLAALDEAPMYFEAVGQAQLPAWSRGRVGLVGDAAYCSSPVSGMGTSLALTGAYVLAGELATAADHRTAFDRYASVMRPYVQRAQKLAPGAPRIANPRSRTGVRALRAALAVAASPAANRVGGFAGRLFSPPPDEIELPTYPAPSPAAPTRSDSPGSVLGHMR